MHRGILLITALMQTRPGRSDERFRGAIHGHNAGVHIKKSESQ